MSKNEAGIQGFKDLSLVIGNGFVEFEIESKAGFNEELADLTFKFAVQKYREAFDHGSFNESQFFNRSSDWLADFYHSTRARSCNFNFLSQNHPHIKSLKGSIRECVNEYGFLYSKQYRDHIPNFISSWALIFMKKGREMPHLHHYNPMNISGVYYLSGDFQKGNGELEVFPNRENLLHKKSYVPQVGRLILFPSDLLHAVSPYLSEKLRISIAFDLWFNPDPKRAFISLK